MIVQGRGADSPEGARGASGGERGRSDRGRFSSRRGIEAVRRLLRGEVLDALSWGLGVGAGAIRVPAAHDRTPARGVARQCKACLQVLHSGRLGGADEGGQ